MAASAPELPEDLALEVLLRLPVRALVRFKSVCKSWRSLIESPAFISRHLERSTSCGDGKNGSGGRSLIVDYRCPATQEHRLSLLSGQTLELNIPVEIPPDLHWKNWGMVGSCNGVVCLSQGDGYSLWNPATREYRVLPECLTSLSRPGMYAVNDGFGYDSAVDDYKIVRIVGTVIADKSRARVEVFALSEGSWREIPPAPFADCVSYNNNKGVSVGGYLYWALSWDDYCILSFDLRDEVFRRVCYPDPSLIGDTNHKRLVVSSGESLCLIVFDYTAIGTVLDLWVMDGGPGKESWTKRLCIGPVITIQIYDPRAFCLNGGILVEKSDGVLAICEAGKENFRDLPVKGARWSLECRFYIESLVRVIR